MKKSEFTEKKIYSEASGSCAIVDENIAMELNEYGMYEEKILLEECEDLNPLVGFVSPNLNNEVNEFDISKKLYAQINDINYDNRIGYYKSLYVGHVSEGDYRENGSSGGMGTWILKSCLKKS